MKTVFQTNYVEEIFMSTKSKQVAYANNMQAVNALAEDGAICTRWIHRPIQWSETYESRHTKSSFILLIYFLSLTSFDSSKFICVLFVIV